MIAMWPFVGPRDDPQPTTGHPVQQQEPANISIHTPRADVPDDAVIIRYADLDEPARRELHRLGTVYGTPATMPSPEHIPVPDTHSMSGSERGNPAGADTAGSFGPFSHRGPYYPTFEPHGQAAPAYHMQTRLRDGRPALLIDPGSVGNLCGSDWATEVAKAAARNGKTPSYEKRAQPLDVSGVGKGSEKCVYDCKLPIALKQADTDQVTHGNVTIPTVKGSALPGLLGLKSMRENRAILDLVKMELHFLGPADYDLPKNLPPGTDTFKLEIAPSGHLVLPCCEYSSGKQADGQLTLMAKPVDKPRCPPPQAQAPTYLPKSTASSPPKHTA